MTRGQKDLVLRTPFIRLINRPNGTLDSIELQKDAKEQQSCFCTEYPFFDSVDGCQACFEEHGGIEGYHWFPSTYIGAASATFCSATSLATGLYPFVSQWAATATAAHVPSTTAKDVLGTSTAASLYDTPTASRVICYSKLANVQEMRN
ncbi:hypothetical protein BGZ57DRAFT_1005474 [Hyaloscypha finlandica]|nr:hypothetical protein BGZ57DRAFT_1005474 [Hyaloscypha finlandica]